MLRLPVFAALFGCLLASSAFAASDLQEVNTLFRQSQYSVALDKVNAYIAKNTEDPQARFLKGLILTEQGKHQDAIRVFTALTEDFPELPEPYNNLAVLYAAQGQYDRAKHALEMAIQTHPSYATAHENLGDIYAKMASQAYDKALSLDKSNASAQTKLSLIRDLFSERRPEAATGKTKVASGKTAKSTKPAKPAEPAKPVAEVAAASVEADAVAASSAASEVTAPAMPAEPVKSAKPATPAQVRKQALDATEAWASAWSKRRVDDYLAFYAADFILPGGVDRADWEKERAARIGKPKSIQVDILDAKATVLSADRVKVDFRQIYRSDSLRSKTRKTLVFARQSELWKIVEEIAH
jgi:tetratricopeptide (TPR) repeat protein